MALDLSALEAQISRDKEVKSSAKKLITGLKAALDAAGTDPAKLKELSDALGVENDTLAQSVIDNTPAEGPPTPESRR